MPTLSGYKIKRWQLHSTVREPGFVVDEAVIEFAEVDETTFLATAVIFNNATPEDDLIEIPVTIGSQQILLFRGVVKDWALHDDPDGTPMARLIAQDARAKLLEQAIPLGWNCSGITWNFRTGTSTPGTTMLQGIKRLAALAGVIIDTTGAPDYAIGPDITPEPGMTVGQAITRLLQAYQQVRRQRVDLIRVGVDAYRLAQRPATLTGGISVPKSAVKIRRYRRTFVPPLDEAVVVGFPVPGTEFTGQFPAIAAHNCDTLTAYDVVLPQDVLRPTAEKVCTPFANYDRDGNIQEEGTICVTRLGDRVQSVTITGNRFSYPLIETPTGSGTFVKQQRVIFVEKNQTFEYDGLGRLVKVVGDRIEAGVLVRRTTKTVVYKDEAQLIEEGMTVQELRTTDRSTGKAINPPQWEITEQEVIRKIATNGLTLKDLERSILDVDDATGVIDLVPGGDAMEVSPGDARIAEEPEARWPSMSFVSGTMSFGTRWYYIDPLIADTTAAATIGAAAQNQGGQWLDEVEIEMPLDLSIGMHSVIDFGTGNLINVQRYLVTQLDIEDSESGRMVVMAEAWTPVVGGTPSGSITPRAGFPVWQRFKDDTLRIMHGIVVAVNTDGTAMVYVPEESVIYPRVWVRPAAGRMLMPRDRINVMRRGLMLSAQA